MKMHAPVRPDSGRPFFITMSMIRLGAVLGCVSLGVTALASASSSAEKLGQTVYARAVAMIIGGPASAGPSSETKAAPVNPALAVPQSPSSTMTVSRRGHTATRLTDGRVLIAGGENAGGQLSDSELFDPASGTFSSSGSMTAARADHAAIKLTDGRVLITGGRNGSNTLSTSEIFDPATGTFSSGPSMVVARAGHSATLLANGRVFIAGGDNGGSKEIYDPTANNFTSGGGSLGTARSMHSAALMLDGRILIAGGRDSAGNALGTVEIFDTAGGSFSTVDGNLTVARVRPHLRVLFDGKVQIIGGSNDGSMEIYDPLVETIGAYAHVLPESDPCTGLINQILSSQTRAALFYAGSSDASRDRSGHTITELTGSNQALVLGGANGSGAVLSSSSLLNSSAASITTDKLDYAPGETVMIAGRGFQPGEIVRLKIHEDPHTPQERGFDATADASGNFSGEYLVQEYDLSMKFIVGARGLSSGFTAQTTFTDARVIKAVSLTYNAATVSCPTGSCTVTPLIVSPGASISASVTATLDGNANAGSWRSTGWSFSSSATPPSPGTENCANTPNHDGPITPSPQDFTEVFPITAPLAAGTYYAHFRAYREEPTAGGPCQNQTGAQAPSAAFTITTAITVDATFPTVSSINRANGSPTNLSDVTWQITFSENVTGVDSADFALVNTGLGGTPSIASVTPITGSTYNVTASTGNGTGSLGLNLNDNDSIADTAGNKLGGTGVGVAGGGGSGNGSFTGQVYALDRTLTPVITVDNKDYDGNTTATILTRNFTSNLPVSGDVQVSGGTANFVDANAGTGKTVNITGLTLIGTDAARYVLSSTSATATANINKAATTTTVTCGAGPFTYNGLAHEPCSANVTGAGGLNQVLTVSYLNNVNAGTATASASYTESANYFGSSDSETFTIDKAATTTTVTCGAGPFTYNGLAHEPCSANVTGAGGLNQVLTVSYLNNVNAGTATASASYVESANYFGSSDNENFTIDKAATTTTVTCGAGPFTYNGLAHEPCSATVTGAGGLNNSLTVSYLNNVNAGTATASASYTESANYFGSSDSENFTIDKAATTTTVTCGAGPFTYNGLAHEPCSANVTGAGGLNQVLTVNYLNNVNAGTATASASYTESANYFASSDSETFPILKAPSTTLVTFEPGPYIFRGTAFTATAQATGAGGLNSSVPVVYSGECTFVSIPNGCTATATYVESANHLGSSDSESITILTACSVFNGFLPPVGGSVENGNGGSFMNPVRSFKLNSTIPVKFNAMCFGAPLTTGVHTLQAIKYSSAMTPSDPIDATPTDAATTGNQFRLTGTEWHFNLSTKGFGNNGQGIWLFKATLFDGSTYSVWVEIKR